MVGLQNVRWNYSINVGYFQASVPIFSEYNLLKGQKNDNL